MESRRLEIVQLINNTPPYRNTLFLNLDGKLDLKALMKDGENDACK